MDLLDRLLGHDAWTTRQILIRCNEVQPADLHRKVDVGHETVYDTLVHMIGNVRVWTDLMEGREVVFDKRSWEGLSVDDLMVRHDMASADFTGLARRIRDQGRFDDLWIDTLDNPPRSKSYGGAIAHVVSHNMHHRGELLHMLSRLGVQNLLEGDVLSWEETISTAG
jgi:uncharacterized damage-inducible protein DinB